MIIGRAVSVPIVVWGSTLVLKWVERYPQIMWIGAAVLGWTAAKMIASEPLLQPWFVRAPWGRVALPALIVGGLIAMPIWRALTPDLRAQSIVIAVVIAWLALFGYVDRQWGQVFDPIDGWQWDRELIDLVRWIGWIPFALLVHRRGSRAESA